MLRSLGYIKLSDYDLAIGPGGKLISLRGNDADDWQIGAGGIPALSAPAALEARTEVFHGAPVNAWSSPPSHPPSTIRAPALPEPAAGSASPSGSSAAAPPRFEPPAAPAPPHNPPAAAAPFSAEPSDSSAAPNKTADAGEEADDDEWQWQLALARARAAAEESERAESADSKAPTGAEASPTRAEPAGDDDETSVATRAAAVGDDDETSVAHQACDEDPNADIDDEPTSSFQAAPPARALPLRPATQTRQIAVAPAPIAKTAATRRRLARGSASYRTTDEVPSRTAAARALAAARASATQIGRQAPLPRISHHRIRPPGVPDSSS